MIESKTLPKDVYYYYPFTYDFHDSNEIIIKELVEKVGCKMLFLPPYLFDLNQIEKCWANMKIERESCW